MKFWAALLLISSAAYAQDLEPAEVLQNVMAEHAMAQALYWKASITLDLSNLDLIAADFAVGQALSSSLPGILYSDRARESFYASQTPYVSNPRVVIDIDDIIALDVHSSPEISVHRVVSSDAARTPEPSLPVHTAAWQAPPPLSGACSGVCVTFSNQGAAALKAITGKRIHGFELVNAMACNLSQTDRKFGGGLIIQQANAMNIQTLSKQAGTAVVQQTLDTNWRKLIMLGLEVGTAVAMGVTSSGVVAASRAWTSGLTLGHLAMDSLPSLLKPGAPNPDPFLNNVLDDNGNVNLVAGGCTAFLFSGVWSRDSVKVTGRVQLIP